MQHRTLGRTGRSVSVVGLGTWQLGADWGDVSEADARAVLEAAAEEGVTFFDTADVYGDGRSETIIGGFLADHRDAGITVATKMGRRVEQLPENYVLENFRAWTERSRRNLGVDTLDLVQLHCPPTSVYTDDELYDALDTLVEEGAVAAYGVSVEKVEEALAAIARPARRDRPDHRQRLPAQAGRGGVPGRRRAGCRRSSSGCRSPPACSRGKYDASTRSPTTTTARYNRDGSAFDVGETFSGVDWETGLPRPRSSPRWPARRPRPAPPPRRRRSAGSGSTTRSPPSSPAPATSSRPGATPPPAAWRRWATASTRRPADLRRAPPGGHPPALVTFSGHLGTCDPAVGTAPAAGSSHIRDRCTPAPSWHEGPGTGHRSGRARPLDRARDRGHIALTDPIAGGRTL